MEQEAMKNIEAERVRLTKKRESLVQAFSKAAEAGKHKRLSELYIKIQQTNEFLRALNGIELPEFKRLSGSRRYAVSSLFLHESFRKLVADEAEQFFFITGTEIDGVLVLDQLAEFAHQKRSVVGVTGEPRATHSLLIKLEKFGHRLLAHFHSHPGQGLEATNPSGIDGIFSAAWRARAMSRSWRYLVATALFGSSGSITILKLKSTETEWKNMRPAFTASQTSIELVGITISGAEDRQRFISGFDQAVFSRGRIICVGAGGLISHIAPTVVRKGIGQITLIDSDVVEASNLNRQRFYQKDLGRNKAVALTENLVFECIAATEIRGLPFRLEEAIDLGMDLAGNVAICGVDNNPARVAASHYFRAAGMPVIFTAVSRDGDHGYVFIQDREGPCIGCVFPDMADDDRFPCPGTPAIADILQAVGALAVYAIDTLLMHRPRSWNYRTISLSDGALDGASFIAARQGCRTCAKDFGKA